MSKITEEEIQKILPAKGPSFEEVKNYLEKYNNEYIIIKCGGSVLVDQDLFNNFINDISILNKLGFIPIIIHGGGKRISIKLNEAGIKSNFINGLRVTDEKSINIVEEVLNTFNREITNALKNNGCDSQGITNKQNNILVVEQENSKLGYVGTPKEINQSTIELIVKEKKVPVIAPLGLDKDNKVYIKMTLTTPNCPVAESLPNEVKNSVKEIKEVKDVDLDLVWDPPWDKSMMSEAAKLELNL